MSITFTSSAFEEGGTIPTEHTADGADASPGLAWGEPPEGTESFAVICDDPDAPMGTWVHWVTFNVPSDARELSVGVPATETLGSGAVQGKNDFGKIGYGGPSPPPGRPHRYYFKLYCLDARLDLPAGATKKQFLRASEDHVLAYGEIMGRYGR